MHQDLEPKTPPSSSLNGGLTALNLSLSSTLNLTETFICGMRTVNGAKQETLA